MSWNYRVIRTDHAETGITTFGIHEVFYGADGSARGFTTKEVGVVADTVDEIGLVLDRMREALTRPGSCADRLSDFPISG